MFDEKEAEVQVQSGLQQLQSPQPDQQLQQLRSLNKNIIYIIF